MNARAMDGRERASGENRMDDERIDAHDAVGAQRASRRGERRTAARDVIDDNRVTRTNRLEVNAYPPIAEPFFRPHGVVDPCGARDRLHPARRFLVGADDDRAAGVAANPSCNRGCGGYVDGPASKDLAE